MTPDTFSKSKKYQQALVTGLLGIILLGAIAFYIYFGMWQAGRNNQVLDQTNPEQNNGIKEDEALKRMRILEQLAARSSSTMSIADREKILDSLNDNSEISTTSVANRVKILEDLNTSQNNEVNQ